MEYAFFFLKMPKLSLIYQLFLTEIGKGGIMVIYCNVGRGGTCSQCAYGSFVVFY